MSKFKFLRSVSPLAIAGGLLAAGPAIAQVAQPAANQVVASADQPQIVASADQASGDAGSLGDGLQEVVVTAQKRSEKAQNVPIDLTVIGKADFAERPRIKSTQDIILFIPSAQGPTTEGPFQTTLFRARHRHQ